MAIAKTPSSQKASVRPVSFYLDDVGSPDNIVSLDLYIRPEDLSISTPSRVSVTQTLGADAWADSFGKGLSTISLSGHTGWRKDDSSGLDGIERFEKLNDTVFQQWHARRESAVKLGTDPEKVRLVFIDGLDNYGAAVIPMQFTLRRSKSRPLLVQYQITMTAVSEEFGLQAGDAGVISGARTQSALDSLFDTIARIQKFVDNVKHAVDVLLIQPIKTLLKITTDIYRSVYNLAKTIAGIPQTLAAAAIGISQSCANIFRTLAAVASIPINVKASLMQASAAFTNAYCLLVNAFKGLRTYPDYSPIYGASNCSSTSGGRPLSPLRNVNPFALTDPLITPPITISAAAQGTLTRLAANDIVQSPISSTDIASSIATLNAGIKVAA